jgi:hypothetical protein
MDLSKSIEPRSDQQNFEDYLAGPKTVKISGVTAGNAEQPVNIELEEYPGRPFKPSKTVRRILVSAWGADSSVYIGRRMTLFGDPTVKWAGETVGGIRVSHLSHIDKPLTIALSVSRGKRQKTTVQPLKEAPGPARFAGFSSHRATASHGSASVLPRVIPSRTETAAGLIRARPGGT